MKSVTPAWRTYGFGRAHNLHLCDASVDGRVGEDVQPCVADTIDHYVTRVGDDQAQFVVAEESTDAAADHRRRADACHRVQAHICVTVRCWFCVSFSILLRLFCSCECHKTRSGGVLSERV